MRDVLAVSTAAPGGGREHMSTRRVVRHLGHRGDPIIHQTPDGWVAFGDPAPDDRLPGHAGGFTVRLTRSSRAPDGDVGTGRLGELLGDGDRLDGDQLASLLPPFAAAHQAVDDAPIVLIGDWLGLRALFWWQSDGIAAVSTSALALAALANATLDIPALGRQSLLGWQVGVGTGYLGISKLAPGCVAVLRRGQVAVRQYVEPALVPHRPAPSPDTAVEGLAAILRDFHQRYLTDHPKTVLQLSGGQDSRMLLCAVPADLRSGLRALTLDVHGGKEYSVASRLADACGLSHEPHWVDERPMVDPGTAYRVTTAASAALNGMASPLARAALVLVESDLEQGHRLTGTGGETVRGFYYPGQPHRSATSDQLVRRLAEWRLFTNEAVEPDALEPAFAEQARAAAIEAVADCFASYQFASYQPDWLRATDDFYLWQRVQRWAGALDTAAAVDRQLVNPLLDRRFLSLALSTRPSDRRHSALAGRLMRRLSPELAAIPLDSGLVPARLARGGARAGIASIRAVAGKTAGKVGQRLRGTRRAQLGAAELASLVVTHWRAHPDLMAPLAGTGIVRASWLDELLNGRRQALPATVAFLVNLLVLNEAVS